MDLFKIERFGEELQEENLIEEQQRKFQQRIEKRRNQKLSIESKTPSKKKKKRHLSDDDDQDNESNCQKENETKSPKKKKKKHKELKNKNSGDEEDGENKTNDNMDSENETESKTPKKKKKKHIKELDNKKSDDQEEENERIDYVDSETETPTKKKKKRKELKNKTSDEESGKVDIDSENETESKTQKKKKKKKRTKPVSDDSDNENGKNNDIVNGSDIKKSSKKKEKHVETTSEALDDNDADDANHNEETHKEEDEKETLFPILHRQHYTGKAKVKRNLPRWLAEPHILRSEQLMLDDVDYLSSGSIENLKKMEISHLFPVQSNVVPVVLEMYKRKKACFPCRDVCVQSPTGSGKTLSYVLPIVEILSKNIIRELQCLVVLPSKDLAAQVKRTFDQCVIGTHLRVGLAAGMKSFTKEQETIVFNRPSGYHSLVDILVCSPGRLVDHLKLTTGFTLSKLRFLVIDEADRMLSENYDNWLELSMKSIQTGGNEQSLYPLTASKFARPIHHIHKFLFSATLTENPEKIAALDLFNPTLFLSQATDETGDSDEENHSKKYAVPEKLTEKMLIVDTFQKPMALLHVLLGYEYKCILCFTNSIESTHRLFLLLQQFDGVRAEEFSSLMNENQRKSVLRNFRAGKLNLLIATDAMSRGMDIKNVDLVVNYDPPNNAKTYIHRVGRTARGEEKGDAITILVTKEVYHFKQMHQSLTSSTKKIRKLNINPNTLATYEEKYEHALQELKSKLENEKKKF